MTKQDFLEGKMFTIANGTTVFKAQPLSYETEVSMIVEVSLTSDRTKVLFTTYECNIDKITDKTFSTYTSVLDKTVKSRIKFEDCKVFEL